MKCFVFKTEPTGGVYRALLDFCCSLTTRMLLIVREPAPALEQLLGQLRPDLLNEERVRAWPGTVLLYGGEATAHWYAVTPRLREQLKALASGLFDWVGSRPEDPCFFRPDGQVLLVTTSHERDAYMMLANDEQEILRRDFPDLVSILDEEGEDR